MRTESIEIINRLGLHARAAAKLVTLASGFESTVELELNNRQVNGKSIMGVMMLAAEMGSKIVITASGQDEVEAIAALVEIIDNKFNED